ncbi:MAG: hypothetical protein KKA79_06130, partial [Nanoarchaeota archaeon]|nr:hypothetical protein [Nanoarchaeota archaeon]
MFCINEKDILNVYKEEGKIKEYNYCKDYLRFMNQKTEKPIKDIANKFCVTYNILLKWKRGDSCPYGIKCLTFLKKRNLLPYYPNERTARIVGFLHGDGCLCNNLLNFCFISKDKAILLKLKKDVEQEFQINGKLKKKRDKGDIEFIHKKYFIVRHPT